MGRAAELQCRVSQTPRVSALIGTLDRQNRIPSAVIYLSFLHHNTKVLPPSLDQARSFKVGVSIAAKQQDNPNAERASVKLVRRAELDGPQITLCLPYTGNNNRSPAVSRKETSRVGESQNSNNSRSKFNDS